MDVIDDFVGEAREVLTSLRAFASAPLLSPASAPCPVSALSALRPVHPSARPFDPDPDPAPAPHASAATSTSTSTSAHQPPQAYRVNRWLTYGEPLQRLREFGVTMKEVVRTSPSPHYT